MTTFRRHQGYRRVPIVTDRRGIRNLCTPVSPEIYDQFEEIAEMLGMSKAALLKLAIEAAIKAAPKKH